MGWTALSLVVVNSTGVLYTLFYTCPALYDEDSGGCERPFIYAIIILSEIAVNLILFHYFNQRNQISYWRVKSSSFPQNFSSSSSSQLSQPFIAVNMNCDEDGTEMADYGKGRNVSPKKKDAPLSILEAFGIVRAADVDNQRYRHSPKASRLIQTYDGVYQKESEHCGGDTVPLLSNGNDAIVGENPRATAGKFCRECNVMTPSRCHHCPLCNICVLRKDHHCFLTGGCVGLANQRYFIVFLFWAAFGGLYGSSYTFSYMNRFIASWYPLGWLYYIGPIALVRWFLSMETFFNTCLAVLFSLSIASSIGALGFFCAQMFYTLNGYTMHDYHVNRHQEKMESDGENFAERLSLVFGRRWWLNFIFPQFWLPNEMTPAIARNVFISVSKDL